MHEVKSPVLLQIDARQHTSFVAPKRDFVAAARERIDALAIIDKFQACILDGALLTEAQIKTGTTLLKKMIPDMTETETKLTGNFVVNVIRFADRLTG